MKVFKNIATLFMAGLLLVASVGVTLNKHHCMGRVKDVALFEKAHSCMEMAGLGDEEDCLPGCCKDTSEEFKVVDFQQASHEVDLSFDGKLLAVITYMMIDLDLVSSATNNTAYLNYKPPLIHKDIPVLVQSFLI